MQLKVNRHRQKQEKYTFTLSLPLFSPEGLFTEGFEVIPPSSLPQPPPPCGFFAFLDNVMQVHNIEDEQPRHRRAGCCAGEVKKYSFQIGFSPLFAIC